MNWFFFLLMFFFQNFANTFTSRARNSASLLRHVKASLLSNGVWVVGQMVLLGPMFENFTGKHGLGIQLLTVAAYTVVTAAGSIAAHKWALHTEKGSTAVGASKLYAQIPVENYNSLMRMHDDFYCIKKQIEESGNAA